MSGNMAAVMNVILVAVFVTLSGWATERCAGQCLTSYTLNSNTKAFQKCSTLPEQGATIAWTLDSSNSTLDVLFAGVATSSSGWVGWGINPTGLAMAGTQAFIAFTASNGSNILTYDVTAATKGGTALKCTPISLNVLDTQVQISGTSMYLYVSLKLAANSSNNLNLVWNRGSSVSNFQPQSHSMTNADLSSFQTLNLTSGSASSSSSSVATHQILKNRHGVLNTVGWGVLLPCGVMAARYLKFADPAWFYIHVFLQLAGYTLGVAGWATGLQLGSYSVGVVFYKHRTIGIVLFSIATLQIMAMLLRPKKDHKIRKAWNLYHYTIGVTILVLGILNIFYGFDMLDPPKVYRRAYVGVLLILAVLVVIFEIASWVYICTVKRRREEDNKLHGANFGVAQGVQNGHV